MTFFAGRLAGALVVPVALACAMPAAAADTPRELLTQAAFVDRDHDVALARIDRAAALANATLARAPGDQEAALMQAMAAGYRAKLTGSRTQAIAARKQYEALVARYPRSAEAQAALGAWHVGVIDKLGALMGRAVAGAQRSLGFAALDRSVALGGERAMFSGLAGLLRLELDPNDARGKALVQSASKAPAPTPLDAYVRRAATAVLGPINAGNAKAIKLTANKVLPFGMVP